MALGSSMSTQKKEIGGIQCVKDQADFIVFAKVHGAICEGIKDLPLRNSVCHHGMPQHSG